MASIPRLLTVDPNGNIPHQVRNAIDLMDRVVIQVDVPTAIEAMDELERGVCQVVVAAWSPGGEMQGWELAAEIKRSADTTAVILLADYDDTQLDEETLQASPFIYFHRPFDATVFLRVIEAGLDGRDAFEAYHNARRGKNETQAPDSGPVPNMNLDRAKTVIDGLLSELGAMAILLATRQGDVLLERGTVGNLKRDELAQVLLPIVNTNMDIKEMVGGNATSIQFYDGDEYDVFVLTVGLHHFMCIIFDGANGARQFGLVNRYGRRSAEDLIALLGADAWLVRRTTVPQTQQPPVRKARPKPAPVQEEIVELEPAVGLGETMLERPEGLDEAIAAAKKEQLEAIPEDEFDLDRLFAEESGGAADDDLFDLDGLEEIARDLDDRQGKLTREQAIELGLINNSNQ